MDKTLIARNKKYKGIYKNRNPRVVNISCN